MSAESLVTIDRVEEVAPDYDRILGHHLDGPTSQSTSDIYALTLEGWALDKESLMSSVEIVHEGVLLWKTPVNIHRPDLAKAFPNLGYAAKGFRTAVSVLRLPREFELTIQTVTEDNQRSTLAVIVGRRAALQAGPEPGISPVLLTTLGRTGSTWLVALLGEHPELVAHRPFVYEPRVVSYWLEVLKTISEPASYLQSVRTELSAGHWWIGDNRNSPLPPTTHDPSVQRLMGDANIRELAAFCRRRIETYYEEVAVTVGKQGAPYFVEKCWPDEFIPSMTAELYPGSREIFLVRDLRDTVCSMVAYNQRLGYEAFGRELVMDDQGHIQELRYSWRRMLDGWRQRRSAAHLVRYEDLIRHPETTLQAMLDYIGVHSDRATVDDIINRARKVKPEAQVAHITSASPEDSIGRWRRDLDPVLQNVCQEAFGDILAELGYTD